MKSDRKPRDGLLAVLVRLPNLRIGAQLITRQYHIGQISSDMGLLVIKMVRCPESCYDCLSI